MYLDTLPTQFDKPRSTLIVVLLSIFWEEHLLCKEQLLIMARIATIIINHTVFLYKFLVNSNVFTIAILLESIIFSYLISNYATAIFHHYSYLTNIDRIKQPDYLPTEQDILRVRLCTNGIAEYRFNSGSLVYR